jgi:hypothetical protein
MKGFGQKEDGTVVCLDSNIWRYVSDHSESSFLGIRAKQLGLSIAASPAVLYEALRSSDPQVRNQLVQLITQKKWRRLKPEAWLESDELIHEIHKHRPQWLKRNSKPEYRKRLEHDWTRGSGGAWDRARVNTLQLSEYLLDEESEMLARSRSKVLQDRQKALDSGIAAENIRLDKKLSLRLNGPGYEIDAWRACTYFYYSKALADGNTAHAEWLQTLVDIKQMLNDPGWITFWHREVTASCLPRAWIRFAMEQLAPYSAVNNGTPCDVQIATYWADCDYFVTADKRFFRLAEICRKHSPSALAEPILLKHQHDIRSSLETALSKACKNSKAKSHSGCQPSS